MFRFWKYPFKAALFNNANFEKEINLPDDNIATIENLIVAYQPQKTILSSVIEHNTAIEAMLSQHSTFHKLSHLTKVNFTTPVGKPETIGADRLALSAAAVHFYPKKNNLIIALGSCITYNFINQYHQFIGGSISPGMGMRFKSLQAFTAKLPLVEKDWNFPLLGYDTKTNIQSGVLAGMAYEIQGFIDAYQQKYSNFNVVLTGGDSTYFARRFKNKIFADSNFYIKDCMHSANLITANKKRWIGLFSATLFCTIAFAQENSPYSRYGLGDLSPNQNISTRGMGGISAGYSDFQSINFTNPASLGNMSNTIFDVGTEVDIRTLKSIDPAKKFTATNALFSYIQLGFPVATQKMMKKINFGE